MSGTFSLDDYIEDDTVFNLLIKLIEMLKSNDDKQKYYYQYEDDSSQTVFERLMDTHSIAIKAGSLNEAKLLAIVLRVIIDGNTNALLLSNLSDDQDEFTYNEYFTLLCKDSRLEEYKEYCTDKLKPVMGSVRISSFMIIDTKEPIVFSSQDLCHYMTDYGSMSSDKYERIGTLFEYV